MSALGAVSIALAVTSLVLAVAMRPGPARWPTVGAGLIEGFRERRRDALAGTRALTILRSVQAGLRSGLPLVAALRVALDGERAAAIVPFARALRAVELSAPVDETARDLARRAHDRRLAAALEAIRIASLELASQRASAIVGAVADRLAFEQQLAEEVCARTSGLRGQIVLLALVVPALTAYLLLTLPGLADTLAAPLGRNVLVPAAAALELAGIAASRLLLRSVA